LPISYGGAPTAKEVSVSPESPLVEVLCFDGCPNYASAVALVERIANELGIRPLIRLVNVPDLESAAQQRFRGEPDEQCVRDALLAARAREDGADGVALGTHD
jgi:hypothetical protein